MARYTGPRCKLSRRENTDLSLTSDLRPLSSKCKLNTTPGGKVSNMSKVSAYGQQLREKQKLKRIYGLLEKQFRRNYKEALRIKGNTGENLISLLESRLDNVVYRAGFASTRAEARQIVSHGAILLNDKPCNIASVIVKVGSVVSLTEKAKKQARIISSLENREKSGMPYWINVQKDNMSATLNSLPERSDILPEVNESLVIELYSR